MTEDQVIDFFEARVLIVSPSGESLLVDTGWEVDGRDAKRVYTAAQGGGAPLHVDPVDIKGAWLRLRRRGWEQQKRDKSDRPSDGRLHNQLLV